MWDSYASYVGREHKDFRAIRADEGNLTIVSPRMA